MASASFDWENSWSSRGQSRLQRLHQRCGPGAVGGKPLFGAQAADLGIDGVDRLQALDHFVRERRLHLRAATPSEAHGQRHGAERTRKYWLLSRSSPPRSAPSLRGPVPSPTLPRDHLNATIGVTFVPGIKHGFMHGICHKPTSKNSSCQAVSQLTRAMPRWGPLLRLHAFAIARRSIPQCTRCASAAGFYDRVGPGTASASVRVVFLLRRGRPPRADHP